MWVLIRKQGSAGQEDASHGPGVSRSSSPRPPRQTKAEEAKARSKVVIDQLWACTGCWPSSWASLGFRLEGDGETLTVAEASWAGAMSGKADSACFLGSDS